MDFIKTVGGRVVSAGLALAVVAGGMSWWRMGPDDREAVVDNATRGGAWFILVLLIPWMLFWLVVRVARLDSNAAGAALVVSITAIEGAWLAYMFGTRGHTPAAWTLFAAAVLGAGVYNLFTCDWIAERIG